jgi:Tat protein translocase TatB subunit
MFDVGFWELVLVFILGLLVLGPDRLPRVARTVGQWVAQAKSVANRFQREIEREIAIQDLQARYERERTQQTPPPAPAGSEAASTAEPSAPAPPSPASPPATSPPPRDPQRT